MRGPLYRFNDYRTLYRLAKSRTISRKDYFYFEEYQGKLLIKYLKHKGVNLGATQLLDLGCGFGGYAISLQETGARVIGLDLDPQKIPGFNQKVLADALKLPFPDFSFNVIVCASLIEHVREPEILLQEITRVMAPGGYLYLSYPPFYSPVGGHQFAPFHLLGERLSLYIFTKRKKFKKNAWIQGHMSMSPGSYAESFGAWGLYRRTIRQIRQMLGKYPLKVVDCSTRLLPINTAVVPILGEFLTWHVQFLAVKK
jgi:SAM-dependent methyltransferase